MKSRRPRLLLAIAALVIAPLFGPAASMQQAPKRPIEVEDVVSWKSLTVNGKKDAIRYQRRFVLESADERGNGIDLSKAQYFSAYGEWTKKGGIARLEPGKPGAKLLTWADASFPARLTDQHPQGAR